MQVFHRNHLYVLNNLGCKFTHIQLSEDYLSYNKPKSDLKIILWLIEFEHNTHNSPSPTYTCSSLKAISS